MKRLTFLFLFFCACSTKSTGPTPPAPTASNGSSVSSVSSAPSAAPAASSSAASTTCSSDGDCSKFSSYCGDLPCACVPYLTSAGAPKCNQPNAVKCLVDPCQRKSAACQDGKCVITAGSTQ